VNDEPKPTTDRRTFIRRTAAMTGAVGAVWVAPQIISSPAGAAPVTYYLELDPDCTPVTTTPSSLDPLCEPAGWTTGVDPPLPGVLNWTMAMNNGLDCSQGFVITFTDYNAVVLGAEAEETCAGSSPPGVVRCVTGTPLAVNVIEFPDMAVPEACVYDVFRIVVQTGS
jgi:hypothetical protein